MSNKKAANYLADITDDDLAEEAITKKRQQGLAWKVCKDICLFALFLTAFTNVVFAAHSTQSALLVSRTREFIDNRQNREASNSPNNGSGSSGTQGSQTSTGADQPTSAAGTSSGSVLGNQERVSLEEVDSVETFWIYIDDFVKRIFQNNTDTAIARSRSNAMVPVDSANRLWGTLQIRQARVARQDGCQIGTMFSMYKTVCYPDYAHGSPSNVPYGPNELFTYDESAPLISDSVTGLYASYEMGGYFMNIPTNTTTAFTKVQNFWANNWVDIQTRAVIVHFTIWNSNLDQYAVSQILFEFPAVGKVRTSTRVLVLTQRLLELMGSSTSSDFIANFMDIVVLAFVLWYIAEELSEISLERWGYLEDGWNILDWTNMGLLMTAYMIRMTAYLDIGAITDLGSVEVSNNQDAYTNLQGVATKVDTARLLNAVNAVLLWSKCAKYIGFFPYVQFLFHTVKDAMRFFFLFLMLFGVIHFGFVVAFVVAFGDTIESLNETGVAWLYTIRAIVGDIDVLPIYQKEKWVGAILILLFYIVIILVALNVFFAIMAATLMENTYSKSKKKDDKEEAILVVVRKVRDTIVAVCQCQRRIKKLWPGLHKRLYGSKKAEDKDGGDDSKGKDKKRDKNKKRGSQAGSSGKRSSELPGADGWIGERSDMKTIRQFSPSEVQRAVENMAGKMLSKIHACGIEIRIEVLRVQESLAQMIAVAESLQIRVEKIRNSQEKFLKDFTTM